MKKPNCTGDKNFWGCRPDSAVYHDVADTIPRLISSISTMARYHLLQQGRPLHCLERVVTSIEVGRHYHGQRNNVAIHAVVVYMLACSIEQRSRAHFVDKVWMFCRIDFRQHAREDPPHASQSEVL